MIYEKFKRLWCNERKINHKLNKIINISKNNVLDKVKKKKPVVFNYYHYGAIWIDPKNLVVWYIFEKDIDLELAKQNGLKNELEQRTRIELRLMGI